VRLRHVVKRWKARNIGERAAGVDGRGSLVVQTDTDAFLVHLDHSDGSGARPLLALADLVFHLLAFLKLLERHALHLRAVKE
jgi:hypothetical protein